MFVDLLNHVAGFFAKKISKLTNTENDKTLFPEFLLLLIVFLHLYGNTSKYGSAQY